MDLLLLGETISASTTSDQSAGYWMPSGGNDGVAGFEVFRVTANNQFTVYMDTKKSDQDDASATLNIGSQSIDGGAVVYKFSVSSAFDLVRYRVKSDVNTDCSVHLQLAQPLWSPN